MLNTTRKLFTITVLTTLANLLCACVNTPPQARASANANLALAMAYLSREQFLKSKHAILTSLNQAPNNPMGWDMLAYYFERTGNTKKAAQYYRYAITLKPHSGQAHNNYGAFLCRKKQYQQALVEFKKAIAQKNYLNREHAYHNVKMCSPRAIG